MAMTVPRQTGSRRKLQRCRTWGSATVELSLVAPTPGPSGYSGDLRYWGITDDADDLGTKQSYHPDWANAQVREQAGNLLWTVKEALLTQPRAEGRLPVLCAPFDAELFGHWWFEGPQLLIAAWSARDYAEARVQSHHTDHKRVVALAPKHARGEPIPDEEWAHLGELCQRDHLFADIQPEWYTG